MSAARVLRAGGSSGEVSAGPWLVRARAHRVHDVGAVCVRGGALAMWRPWLARMVRYDGRASRHANQCPKGWSLTKDELTSAWSKHSHAALRAGAHAATCRGVTACVCRYSCPVLCVLGRELEGAGNVRVRPWARAHVHEYSQANTRTGLMRERAATVMGDQRRWPCVAVHDVPVQVRYSCV